LKYKFFLLAAAVFFVISGCASVPVGKGILDFEIKPDSGIKPGTIITVTVRTTAEIEKVYGYMDVLGSPKVPLKYNTKKSAWIFNYMIPMTVSLPRGEFSAKVEAITKSGEKHTAEKKISTY